MKNNRATVGKVESKEVFSRWQKLQCVGLVIYKNHSVAYRIEGMGLEHGTGLDP